MNLALQKSAAAFFDLDGTLLPGPSLERRFLRFLFERGEWSPVSLARWFGRFLGTAAFGEGGGDRKSTRLNSSHLVISYAVFCLKKKKNKKRADAVSGCTSL